MSNYDEFTTPELEDLRTKLNDADEALRKLPIHIDQWRKRLDISDASKTLREHISNLRGEIYFRNRARRLAFLPIILESILRNLLAYMLEYEAVIIRAETLEVGDVFSSLGRYYEVIAVLNTANNRVAIKSKNIKLDGVSESAIQTKDKNTAILTFRS